MTAHPVIRTLHDLGAATWFGGALAGATGLNGAAAELDDPSERARISTAGWSKWTPVGTAGVLAHVVGAAGLTVTDAKRVAGQHGVGRSTALKAVLTAAGLGVDAWSVALNRKLAAAGPVPVQGATEPGPDTPPDVAKTLQQLKLVQWLNPALAGAVIATASWQSQQQRPLQVMRGIAQRGVGATTRGSRLAPAVGKVAGPVAKRAAGPTAKRAADVAPAGTAALLPLLGAAGLVAVLVQLFSKPKGEEYPTPPVVQRPEPGGGVIDLTTTEPAVREPAAGPTYP